MAESKYKLFRNFMVNELGISKEDIKQWTKEAVAETVKKQMGQIDVDGITKRALQQERYNITGRASKELVKELADRLQVRIQWREAE